MSESSGDAGGTGQATGSGNRADAPGHEAPPVDQAASTGGLGNMASQQAGGGAPDESAPYTLNPDGESEARSDSGT